MYIKYFSFGVQFVLMCYLQDLASAHLGKPCHLDICMSTFLIPIKNAFCDSDNICKCEPGYVSVGRHKCSEGQDYGNLCEHDNVCKLKDENSFCDKSRYNAVCECRKSFYYDNVQKKCIPQIKKPKSVPLFPITAVILIACIGICGGCGIICHNFIRQPELSLSVEQIRRTPRNPTNPGQVRNVTSPPNDPSNQDTVNHPPLLRSESRSSSTKYDSLLCDDPPPKYEDAIKDYPSEIAI